MQQLFYSVSQLKSWFYLFDKISNEIENIIQKLKMKILKIKNKINFKDNLELKNISFNHGDKNILKILFKKKRNFFI